MSASEKARSPVRRTSSFVYLASLATTAARMRAVASPRSSSLAQATPGAAPSCGMRIVGGDEVGGAESEKKAV